MSSMANLPRTKRVRSLHSLVQVGAITGVAEAMEQVLILVEKVRSFHSHKTLATDVAKTDARKPRTRALDTVYRGCGKKGHLEKVCLKKRSTHSLEVPQASTSSAGAGASEPLYFDDDGQPIFAHMVSVPHTNKHLITFPIALDYTTLRSWIGNSTTPPQMVLLKADTGANVNLMNRQMFHQLFGKAKDLLQPTPIRMENYGNSAVKVLGMFYVFLRWKDKVYKQLFYVTDCDRSPNLLSRDACYTLGDLKPCYTVESGGVSTKHEHSFFHQKMNGPEKKSV